MTSIRNSPHGPFTADQLKSGDPYELHEGHAYFCAPAGGVGATRTGLAYQVIASDPKVEDAAIDAGFAPDAKTLWAPDVAVGVPADERGWVKGVPPLAVEYAGVGQDEDLLQRKIDDLLARGTRWIWVVRLVGPRRIDVHEPGKPVRVVGTGQLLEAPGVLAHAIPFEAFFDAGASRDATLHNLLARFGYQSLDEVRAEGRLEGKAEGRLEGKAEGRAEGQRELVTHLLERRFGALSERDRARLATADPTQLDRWALALLDAPTLDAVLGVTEA